MHYNITETETVSLSLFFFLGGGDGEGDTFRGTLFLLDLFGGSKETPWSAIQSEYSELSSDSDSEPKSELAIESDKEDVDVEVVKLAFSAF